MAVATTPGKLAEDFKLWMSQSNWQYIANVYAPRRQGAILGRLEIVRATIKPVEGKLARMIVKSSGMFEVSESARGGLGVFASQNLSRGTGIHLESPLVRGTPGTKLLWNVEDLPFEEKAIFMGLHGYEKLAQDRIIRIFKTNQFRLPNGEGGVFAVASRFNHSCNPSCAYRWNEVEGTMVFDTVQDIMEGDEITISYGGTPYSLWKDYGFKCDCGYCPATTLAQLVQRDAEEKTEVERHRMEMKVDGCKSDREKSIDMEKLESTRERDTEDESWKFHGNW